MCVCVCVSNSMTLGFSICSYGFLEGSLHRLAQGGLSRDPQSRVPPTPFKTTQPTGSQRLLSSTLQASCYTSIKQTTAMTNTACTHSTVSLFHLPDPWRTSLIRDELDSSSRAAVAQTCKPGLTWLLSEWPEATLHIPVRPSSALHPVRLQLAREQLALRGGLQTTIAFEKQGEMQPDDWWWETVLPALSTGARGYQVLAPQ